MSPRCLLLLWVVVLATTVACRFLVTLTEQSVDLFHHAGQPNDLHLFAETDHLMFAESNTRVRTVIFDRRARQFPVKAREAVGRATHLEQANLIKLEAHYPSHISNVPCASIDGIPYKIVQHLKERI